MRRVIATRKDIFLLVLTLICRAQVLSDIGHGFSCQVIVMYFSKSRNLHLNAQLISSVGDLIGLGGSSRWYSFISVQSSVNVRRVGQ